MSTARSSRSQSSVLGLTFLVPPPSDGDNLGRWLLFGVAAIGATAETVWIVTVQHEDQLRAIRRSREERHKRASDALGQR